MATRRRTRYFADVNKMMPVVVVVLALWASCSSPASTSTSPNRSDRRARLDPSLPWKNSGMADAAFDLTRFPVHLGLGSTARSSPNSTAAASGNQRYGEDNTAAGRAEGRLVSMYTFTEPWSTWEVHPHGHELVLCVAGEIVLHQRIGDEIRSVTLGPGQAAINEPGCSTPPTWPGRRRSCSSPAVPWTPRTSHAEPSPVSPPSRQASGPVGWHTGP